jgi:hypothetical protein
MATLVFDEQIASARLVQALSERGIDAATVGDFGAEGTADPDVVRRVARELGSAWVLVTMDLKIVDEHQGFDWGRYAIAWVPLRQGISGGRVEVEKTEIVQRHAHEIREQSPGDHYTYTTDKRFKHRPSLASIMRGV